MMWSLLRRVLLGSSLGSLFFLEVLVCEHDHDLKLGLLHDEFLLGLGANPNPIAGTYTDQYSNDDCHAKYPLGCLSSPWPKAPNLAFS